VTQTRQPAPSRRARWIAVGILVAIGLIPLFNAAMKVRSAEQLTGSVMAMPGVVVQHELVSPVSKTPTKGWYTTIVVPGPRTVVVEGKTLYDSVKDGDRVGVEVRGTTDHVTRVRTPSGQVLTLGDTWSSAVIGAFIWGALGLAIIVVALLLGRRAGRKARAADAAAAS
jgi:hypothetical protein